MCILWLLTLRGTTVLKRQSSAIDAVLLLRRDPWRVYVPEKAPHQLTFDRPPFVKRIPTCLRSDMLLLYDALANEISDNLLMRDMRFSPSDG